MNTEAIHLTCLCGKTHDIDKQTTITCRCGQTINGKSLHFLTLPASRNVRLVSYMDTGNPDKDLFGESYDDHAIKPIYCDFEFHTEYNEGGGQDADSHLVATALSDPSITFKSYHYKHLLEQIDSHLFNELMWREDIQRIFFPRRP